MFGPRRARAGSGRFDLPGQVDTPARRQLATFVAGLLVLSGAVLAGVDAIAPPMSAIWLLATIGAIGIVGLLMALGLLGAWSPTWLTAGVFALQAVMTLLLIASGSNDGNTRLFFVWLTPYAAFFLGRRVAAAFVCWVAVLLMLGLVITGDTAWKIGLAWISTISLMVSITLFVLWSSAMLRTMQTKAYEEARRDPLTGLANRVAWNSSVNHSIEGLGTDGGRLIVLLIDLDDFKGINDTYGHAAGDELLRQVAPRLQGAVRPDDTVARLGGDEFALLCSDPALALEPDELVERIRAALDRPYLLAGGEQVYPGASIGVVVALDVVTADELLTRADIAMYRAKASGRNQAMRFDDSMARESAERHELVTALHRALELEQCQVVYQAAYDLQEHRLIGAEALLRWHHPTLGPVSPDRFIPLAEATGQVGAFTDFVLGESLEMLSSWRATGWVDEGFTLSVNVSVRDVRPGFADRVLAALARNRIPPTCLAVELTETALMDESADIDELRSLREAGVWVVLDDFGSGYSSLAYLERLPLDGIKMDREFLPTADSNRRWEIVAAILEMARALHLHVVAEGVETQEQADQLRRLGCRIVQGFLFASPVPAAEFGISRPQIAAMQVAERP